MKQEQDSESFVYNSRSQRSAESFSYHADNQQPDLIKQIQFMQKQYVKLQRKYQKLKSKYHETSDQQNGDKNEIIKPKISNIQQKYSTKQIIKSKVHNQNRQEQKSLNTSSQFSWNQSQSNNLIQKSPILNYYALPNEIISKSNNISKNSSNFSYHESNHDQSRFLKKAQHISKDQHIKTQTKYQQNNFSKNSDNFSFSQQQSAKIQLSQSVRLQSFRNKQKILQQQNSIANSDNFSFSQKSIVLNEVKKPSVFHKNETSNNLVYEIKNKKQQFGYNQSQNQVNNSDNFTFSLNENEDYKHEDKTDSNNFIINKFQIKPKILILQNSTHINQKLFNRKKEKSQQIKLQKNEANSKTQIIDQMNKINDKKLQQNIQGVVGKQEISKSSYYSSGQVNNNYLQYELKEFSFQLPQKINDPISIQYESQQKYKFEQIKQVVKEVKEKQQIKQKQSMIKYNKTLRQLQQQRKKIQFKKCKQMQILSLKQQQLKYQLLKEKQIKQKLKKQLKQKQISSDNQINTNTNNDYDEQNESEDEQKQFLKKLLNLLGMRKKLSSVQLKELYNKSKQLSQDNNQLQQIHQTGTFKLDLLQKNQYKIGDQRYVNKLLGWNRLLITQLSISYNFFKQIQFPNLKQLTILLDYNYMFFFQQQGELVKKINQNYDLNFIKYYNLNKQLNTLCIKGQFISQLIAMSIVDIDFPKLKQLYISLQAPLTNQVVEILICNKFQNLPKCKKIFIATWQGQRDHRFKSIANKIQFTPINQNYDDFF